MRAKLSGLQKAQETAAVTKTLPDGRIRYYTQEVPARTEGATRGASFATEYNPTTGSTRQWMESYDHSGNVIRVHPKRKYRVRPRLNNGGLTPVINPIFSTNDEHPSSGGFGDSSVVNPTPHTGGTQLDGQQDDGKYVTPEHRLDPGNMYSESDGAKGLGKDYVDILSPEAKQHILYGDKPGSGGHMWPGQEGKTVFPDSWSGDKIVDAVGDITTSPSTKWYAQTGTGGAYTAKGDAAKWVAYETRDGVRMRVVYQPATGKVVTTFPDDAPIPPYKPIK